MKKKLLLFLLTAMYINTHAQYTREERLADSVIGWWPENKYDKLKAGTDAVSQQKIKNINLFAEWVKKTFTPVGGIGSYQRYINDIYYGVAFDVWDVASKLENGRYRPEGHTNITFRMEANRIQGAYDIYFMNAPGKPVYFAWEPDGYAETQQLADKRKGSDSKISSNAYAFLPRINELHTVYLVPGNKLPIISVTKGELLDQAEASLANVLENERKDATQKYQRDTRSIEYAMEYKRKEVEKYRSKIQQLRKKHIATLNEPAVINALQPTMESFDTDPDIFDLNTWAGAQPLKHTYPVYKMDVATIEKARSATPLWIALSFPFQTKADRTKAYEIYRALTENFNYAYVYNYFFSPEKVKGIAYTPVDPEGLKARLDGYRNKYKKEAIVTIAKNEKLQAGSLLYDNFSKDAPGTKPAGWLVPDNDRNTLVTTLKGESDHWLSLSYNKTVKPATISSLPSDFILSFDLLTGAFTGVTGGRLTITLGGSTGTGANKKSTQFFFEITSGQAAAFRANHNYRGLARVRLSNIPSKMSYNDQGGFAELPQAFFTDEKRKVRVTIKKQEGNISVLLDNKPFISSAGLKTRYNDKPCGDCTIPTGILFNKIEIQNMTQDAGEVGTYITNFNITQL